MAYHIWEADNTKELDMTQDGSFELSPDFTTTYDKSTFKTSIEKICKSLWCARDDVLIHPFG